jgi:hypothetical protein
MFRTKILYIFITSHVHATCAVHPFLKFLCLPLPFFFCRRHSIFNVSLPYFTTGLYNFNYARLDAKRINILNLFYKVFSVIPKCIFLRRAFLTTTGRTSNAFILVYPFSLFWMADGVSCHDECCTTQPTIA